MRSQAARRQAALAAAALAAAFAVSACSLFRARPRAPLQGPRFPLVAAVRIPYQGRVVPPVLYAAGRVFLVTDIGHCLAVDVGSAAKAWEFRTAHPVSKPAGLGRERVYVVDEGRELYSLDFEGRLLWRKSFDETVSGPMNEAGGMLCLGTEEGSLVALRPEDGSEVWRFRAGHAVRTGAILWTDRRGTPFFLCGGDEGKIYFLSSEGDRRGQIECRGKLLLPPFLEGDRLYAGIEGDALVCLNLAKRSVAWKVRLAGRPATGIFSDAGRLFFLTGQGVLMSLDKRSGSILWWRTMSSRTAFDPAPAGEQVLAAALSGKLAGFNSRTGKETGFFQAEGGFRANPVWAKPWVLAPVADGESRSEELLFLKRQPPVVLNASKPSPVKPGEEVVFTASVTGFTKPSFEFILKSNGRELIVQAASTGASWTWHPEEEGDYRVAVRVAQGGESEEAELEIRVVR